MVIFFQRWDGNITFSGHYCHWCFSNGFVASQPSPTMFFHRWTIGNYGLLMVFKILGMMVIDGKGQNCRFLDFWNSPTFQVILEKGQAETFQGFLGSHNKYPGWNRSESENREFFNWRHAKSYWRWRANFWYHRKVSIVLGEPWPKMTHSIKMT